MGRIVANNYIKILPIYNFNFVGILNMVMEVAWQQWTKKSKFGKTYLPNSRSILKKKKKKLIIKKSFIIPFLNVMKNIWSTTIFNSMHVPFSSHTLYTWNWVSFLHEIYYFKGLSIIHIFCEGKWLFWL